jgi:uncharacterized protein YcaQ
VVESVSPAQARRIALAAQGFGRPRGIVGTRQLNLTFERLRLLQLDSVNVFERSHYLPVFARLGGYDKELLDRLTFASPQKYVEYWAHEAAVIPVSDWPLWRWKMESLAARDPVRYEWARENTAMLDWLRAELADRGPVTAGQIEHDANKRVGPWWGWSDVKHGLEFLFRWGEVVTAGRRRFERTYALPEHVLSSDIREATVSREDAQRELVERSSAALGIATASDLADYFRLRADAVRPAVADLEEAGTLIPVTVPGWKQKAWLHRDARIPRKMATTALLSPFDPVVWDRSRALRMFGFHYRIEIYTPAPKRQYGYYTLPLLQDEGIVGRIDLKTDRQARVLRVQSAWREPEASIDLDRVVALLRETAAWQSMESISVADWGDLAPSLAAALGVALAPRT